MNLTSVLNYEIVIKRSSFLVVIDPIEQHLVTTLISLN